MQRHLALTTEPIDEAALVGARRMSAGLGAAAYFVGVVRGLEAGEPVAGLDYEVFGPMAEHQFHRLFDEVEKRWPVASVRLVHRVGWVAVGEPSLWVEVLAPHRQEAFAACEWIIEEMKRVVPIWKHPTRGTAAAPDPPGQQSHTPQQSH
jgi:molybdopterin synthase catalytic subunit